MKTQPDHFRRRYKYKPTDETVIDASYKLTEMQFEAWKLAFIHGRNNIEISDALSTASRPIFPSEAQGYLDGAAKRGFPIPGEERPVFRTPGVLTVVA